MYWAAVLLTRCWALHTSLPSSTHGRQMGEPGRAGRAYSHAKATGREACEGTSSLVEKGKGWIIANEPR